MSNLNLITRSAHSYVCPENNTSNPFFLYNPLDTIKPDKGKTLDIKNSLAGIKSSNYLHTQQNINYG